MSFWFSLFYQPSRVRATATVYLSICVQIVIPFGCDILAFTLHCISLKSITALTGV